MMVNEEVMSASAAGYHPYPPALATYQDVVASPDLFMDSLRKLHVAMGTKFMIPVVGGRDLDLHRLFVEVTSRGGIAKVVKDRKWKEVTCVFSFPSSATNASFILRKYYISLLYHFEQIYFFKAKCWTPSPTDGMQHLSTASASPPPGLPDQYAAASSGTPPTFTASQQVGTNSAFPSLQASIGSPVCGVIDGKFDGGYLVTVQIGASEELKGVLYQVPDSRPPPLSHYSLAGTGAPRRKRRKKSEIRRRDPAHPKPNRSGYNFFFAEQHAKLKPLYQGKDREISRIIGESWNKLQEHERAVYQDKALKDKERYKVEMEDYRKRLRSSQIVIPTSAPQQPPVINPSNSLQYEGATLAYTAENEAAVADKSNLEEYDDSADKDDSEFGECSQGEMDLKNVNVEIMADEAFDLQRVGWDKDKISAGNGNAITDIENVNAMWLSDEKNCNNNMAVTAGEGGISSVCIQKDGEQLLPQRNAGESISP